MGLLGLAAVGAVALGAGYALAASQAISSSATCCTFSQPSFTIDAGQVATFSNAAATASHNVTAAGKGPDGKKLFRSPDLTGGQVAQVDGTQYLTPGTYHFVCTIHEGMAADLVVTGNGTPVARPSISVEVTSGTLDAVVASGKLKVKVSAQTQSHGIALVARKGARKLGSKPGIDLVAGASQVVKLPLSRSGRRALAGLGSATVKVSGSVPFGAGATATRKLR